MREPRTEADYDAIFQLIADHPNVSCDLAMATGYTGPAFLERLVRAVGADKVMYGTDWPYWTNGPDSYTTGRARWTIIADECPFLLDGEKQAILAGNAERFLRFQVPRVQRSRSSAARSCVSATGSESSSA